MWYRRAAFWVLIGGVLLAGAGIAGVVLVSGVETSVLDSGSQTAARASLFWFFESLAVFCRLLTLIGLAAFGYALYALWPRRGRPKQDPQG